MPTTTTDPCQKIADLIKSLEKQLANDQKLLQAATIPEQKVALEQAIFAIGVQIRSETALLGKCRSGTGTGGTGTGGVPAPCKALAASVAVLEKERERLFALLATASIEQKVALEAQIAALGIVLQKEQQSLAACLKNN